MKILTLDIAFDDCPTGQRKFVPTEIDSPKGKLNWKDKIYVIFFKVLSFKFFSLNLIVLSINITEKTYVLRCPDNLFKK